MVSWSGVATNCSGGRAAPSSFSARSLSASPSSISGAGAAPFPLGRSVSAARRRVERDIEFHAVDQPVGRAVIFKPDRTRLFGAHVGSVGEEQGGTFLLIYRQIASCFNRFPGSRNPLYGCADNIGRNVMTV